MENAEKIENTYEKLLEIADSAGKADQYEESMKKFNELKETVNQMSTEDDGPIPEYTTTSAQTDETTPEGSTVMVSYNPNNGEQMVVDDASAEESTNKSFEAFLKDGNIDMSSIENIMNSKEVKDFQDSAKIAAIMQRRMNGESFDYYNELPESLQKEVSKIASSVDYRGTGKKPLSKNTIAKMFIDDMIETYKKESQENMQLDLDTMLAGFDKDVEKMSNEFATDLGKIMMSFDEERKAEIDAGIKRCEEAGNTEAADKLRQIKDTLDKAYNLDEFAEFCTHCKIKNYDMEKPQRIYDDFNYKYLTHKNTINDIASCPAILDRHLPEFTHNQKVMICIAFCKYCRNMSPDNMEEHTFMYYFIRNIIAIDRINPKGIGYDTMDERSKKFYDEFTASLSKCINNLIQRNITLK